MYLRYRGVWFVRARGAHAFVLVVDFRRSNQSLFKRPRPVKRAVKQKEREREREKHTETHNTHKCTYI